MIIYFPISSGGPRKPISYGVIMWTETNAVTVNVKYIPFKFPTFQSDRIVRGHRLTDVAVHFVIYRVYRYISHPASC